MARTTYLENILNITFLASLIYTLFYVLANLLLGLILLKVLFRRQWGQYSFLVILTTSFLLGQGILAAIWQLLGLVGQFKVGIIWGILALVSVVSIFIWYDLFQLIKRTIKNTWVAFINISFLWKLLLSMIFLLMFFFAAGSIILPPSGDAEAFYMVLPKIMAHTGILKPQPNYYEFSKIGLLGEMHFAALMAIANLVATKFFVWFTMLAVASFLISIGTKTNLKTKGQIIALAILFTSTTFTSYITDGKTDIFSAAFGLATYYWVLETRRKGWLPLVLTGLFMGFAIVAKLSNAIVIVPGVLLILGWNRYNDFKDDRQAIKIFFKQLIISLLILGLFVGVALIPHFIKNKVLFNDPLGVSEKYENFQWIYPIWASTRILYSFSLSTPRPTSTPIPTPALTPALTLTPIPITEPTVIPSSPAVINKKRNIIFTFLTYPLAFVFGNRPGQGGSLSVLIIAFLPFLLFLRPIKLVQKQILAMALLGLAIWLVVRASATTPRYILPTLLLFIPAVAAGTEYIFQKMNYFLLKLTIIGSMFLILLVFLTIHFNIFMRFGLIALGRSDPTVLYGPHYPALQFINQKASDGDRVFLVGYYGFFLRPDLLAKMDDNQEKLDIILTIQATPWEYMYNHNFKYVVVQKAPHLQAEDSLNLSPRPDWLNIQKIYSDTMTDIYSLEKK